MSTKEAVERSISHDRIVTISARSKDEAKKFISDLGRIAADRDLEFDWTDSNEGYETWAYALGAADGDMAWRVHIAL